MKLRVLIVCLAAATALCGATVSSSVTFNKDIQPILEKNCQGCHRPGEVAPMSFLTYQETRPWAKAIREAVLSKRMPPWFADPHHGKFSNDRSLEPGDIEKLTAWAERGAPEGKPAGRSQSKPFVEGWNIGTPDAVFEMPIEFQVPPSGTIDYQYVVIPTGLTEDKWIQMAEVRPGNRALVHHVIAFVREPGAKWLSEAKPGEPFVPRRRSSQGGEQRREGGEPQRREEVREGEFVVGFAPGTVPEILAPGQGKLIKAGSDLVFQMHYTANGKAGVDRTKIGLIFAKQPPAQRIFTIAAMNRKFVIPAGAANYQVDAQMTLHGEVTLTALLPHMHLRGKDFEYRVVYPTGESQVLLRVPKYSFNWQLSYYLEKPLLLPKGTRIECTAHFDNSPNNADNPDPNSDVRWGDQSWEEMMIGFMDVAFDAKTNPEDLLREKKPAPARTGE